MSRAHKKKLKQKTMSGFNLNKGNLGRKKEDVVLNIITAKPSTKDTKTKEIDHPESMIKKITRVAKNTTIEKTKQKANLAISLLEKVEQNKPISTGNKMNILNELKKIR